MLKQRALHRGSLLAAPTRCRQLPLLRAFNSYTDPSQEQQLGHEPAVEPPQAVAWNPENVNHVRLTGTVISQPKVQHTTGSQTVANFLLGLRRRFGRTLGSESVTLEAWGFNSLQAAQHLSPGMRIQVEGQLKENVWTDAATFQEKRKLKVRKCKPWGFERGKSLAAVPSFDLLCDLILLDKKSCRPYPAAAPTQFRNTAGILTHRARLSGWPPPCPCAATTGGSGPLLYRHLRC